MELDAEVVINRRDVGDISSIITCTGVALHADPSDTGTFGSTNKSRVSTPVSYTHLTLPTKA